MDDEKRKAITQLQEIFHITPTEAENSYHFYKCNLSDAIDGLAAKMDRSLNDAIENSPISRQAGNESNNNAVATCSPNPTPASDGVTSTGSTTSNPIDLTQDDDLQKALALSLQDMQHQNGGISFEDQELSRALEASIAETQSDKTRSVTFLIDPTNPHERKRTDDRPSLFYIPIFRQLILSYRPVDTTDKKLFALLLRSNQKYINPKPAIDLLQSVFNQSNQQQDVSEFTHKLLEWIEDAFKFSKASDQTNPMLDLFTGQCVTEGLSNEQHFVNESQFGAFPVQIEGHTHLHDSLEAATVNTEMNQETWFTRLPRVLVIELSRFNYNQTTGQTEKIHDQLHFDKTLFMDRYMRENCQYSRRCRQEVTKLKIKINNLQKSLERYTNYCGKGVAINDILSMSLYFISRGEDKIKGDGVMEEDNGPLPKSGTSSDMLQVKSHLHQWIREMDAEISELQEGLCATQDTLKAVYSDQTMNKVAFNLHAVLVHQGQASRGHYWAYVKKGEGKGTEEEVQHINGKGTRSDDGDDSGDMEVEIIEPDSHATVEHISTNDLSATTSSTSLMDVGSATPEGRSYWLKFNDVSVTEVDWDEVQKESYGQANTSAYCLVYINANAERHWKEEPMVGQMLPPFLDQFVKESNSSFDKELQSYDLMKQLKEKAPPTSSSPREAIKPAKSVRFESDVISCDDSNGYDAQVLASDAKRARAESPSILEDMQIDAENIPPPDPLLKTQLDARLEQKLRTLSMELPPTIVEPRLLTEFHYASICQSSPGVRQALLLFEVYHDAEREDNLPLSYLGRKEYLAICKDSIVNNELKLIRELYHLFCCVCYHLVQSISEIKKDNWCLALTHSLQCFELNSQICSLSNEDHALQQQLLRRFRSKTLLEVSQLGTSAFTSGEVGMSLSIGNEYIVPTLKSFSQYSCDSNDEKVLEKVREEWCHCLDQSTLTEDDSDKLADLLVKIVEDYTKVPNIKLPQTPQNYDTQRLAAQFTNAYKMLTNQILSDS